MNPELLAKKYRYLTVANRTAHSAQILYGNGDSVQIQPNSTARIMTEGLAQIPNSTIFDLVNPTIAQLIEDGIVTAVITQAA